MIRNNGDVQQTFLVDGFVAGFWHLVTAASSSTRSSRCPRASGASWSAKRRRWPRSTRERTRPHAARAESSAARAAAAARALALAAPARRRADGRDPGAVRALGVHRPLVAVDGFRARRSSRARSSGARSCRATLLRGTIHIVSRRDHWPLRDAVPRVATRRGSRRRATARIAPPRSRGRDAAARAALADGPRRARSSIALVGKDGLGSAAGVDLVRVPPSGTWERRRADLYALADEWVGADDAGRRGRRASSSSAATSARSGPRASPTSPSWSRLPRADIERGARSRRDLRRFRDEHGQGARRPAAGAASGPGDAGAARVSSGTWDAMLLVHARRTGVLPEEFRPRIFNTKAPHSIHTFLVDGAVAGAWRYEEGRIRVAAVPEADARRAGGARGGGGAASRVPRVSRRRSRQCRRRSEPTPCPCRRSRATRRSASRRVRPHGRAPSLRPRPRARCGRTDSLDQHRGLGYSDTSRGGPWRACGSAS